MELFHASQQWATRPADERFDSLDAMFWATKAYADDATERSVPWSDVRVDAGDGSNLTLVGRAGVPATLTHHAFGQIAARVGAPASYLRALPPTLAAQNLNHGLKNRSGGGEAKMLFHVNDTVLLRAVTSEVYERVWNHEVIGRVRGLADAVGLVPGQQTFNWADGGPGTGAGMALKPDAPKALYASDHDMFAFLMSPDRTVLDPMGQPMRRGVIVGNSEVGAGSLWLMTFLFRDVCCNHIIWGANGVAEIRMPHVGKIRDKFWEAQMTVRRYLDGAASLEQAQFEELMVRIADDKDAVLDKLFGIRSLGLSRKVLAASYDAAIPEEDGDPRTVWGMAGGITRQAQETPFADERHALDRAAGRLLAFRF